MTDLWHLIAGDLLPWQVVTMLGAALAVGIFHTLSGFAGGVILSIIIAPIVRVEAVIPIMAVVLVVSGMSRMWAFRRDLDVGVYLNLIVPAFPGIVAGALIYSYLAPWVISVVLGAFLLLTVAARRPLEKSGVRVGTVGLGAVGTLFGLLSGVSIGAGMVLAPFLIGKGIVKQRLAAMYAAVGLVLNVSKTTIFLATSTLDQHLLFLGLLIGLFSVPGNYIGYAILMRTSVRVHTTFIEGIVFAAGIAFIWIGLQG